MSSWQLPYSGNDSTVPQYIDTNDGGYVLFCIIFILLGSSGFVLNSRALYSFFIIHAVSLSLIYVIASKWCIFNIPLNYNGIRHSKLLSGKEQNQFCGTQHHI